MKSTESTPEEIIANPEIDAFVVAIYENTRPFRGLAFKLDWRFRGVISDYYQKGMIKGEAGECTLIPIVRGESTDQKSYKLILVGAGKFNESQTEMRLPVRSIEMLKKNILKLGIQNLGVSKSDLGASLQDIVQSTKGVEVWVTP